MLGVGNYPAHPPALKTMITLLSSVLAPIPVSQDVPGDVEGGYPDTFVCVDLVGGYETANGHISVPTFAFQCYALGAGSAEELAGNLLAALKSAQFTVVGGAQLRNFTATGGPYNFPDPDVPRRRWQLVGTFAMN